MLHIPLTPMRRSKWHTPRHQAFTNSDQTDPFPLFTDRQCIRVQMFTVVDFSSTGATLTKQYP